MIAGMGVCNYARNGLEETTFPISPVRLPWGVRKAVS